VFSSLTHEKIMILLFVSNRKNTLNRRPIFARRQCRKAGPMVFPRRYSSRLGSLGTASNINFEIDAKRRTFEFDWKSFGSCCLALSAAKFALNVGDKIHRLFECG